MHRALPTHLSPIGRILRAQHRRLAPRDRCYFLAELAANADARRDPIKDLITNFKITPTQLHAKPARRNWKEWAIRTVGDALAHQLAGTPPNHLIVPIPASKLPGHPDYDDRMLRALTHANARLTPTLHIRQLVKQRASTTADHETSTRQSYYQLLANCYLDEREAPRTAPTAVLLIDDILTDGKHFKVCQHLIRRRYGSIPIIGLFIARRVNTAWRPSHAHAHRPFERVTPIADSPPSRPLWLTDLQRTPPR